MIVSEAEYIQKFIEEYNMILTSEHSKVLYLAVNLICDVYLPSHHTIP